MSHIKITICPRTTSAAGDETPRFRFSLRTLFWVTAGAAVLFSILRGLGLGPVDFLLGLAIFPPLAVLWMLIVESGANIGRPHPWDVRHARRLGPHYNGHAGAGRQ